MYLHGLPREPIGLALPPVSHPKCFWPDKTWVLVLLGLPWNPWLQYHPPNLRYISSASLVVYRYVAHFHYLSSILILFATYIVAGIIIQPPE
jgi:hypothetical protein